MTSRGGTRQGPKDTAVLCRSGLDRCSRADFGTRADRGASGATAAFSLVSAEGRGAAPRACANGAAGPWRSEWPWRSSSCCKTFFLRLLLGRAGAGTSLQGAPCDVVGGGGTAAFVLLIGTLGIAGRAASLAGLVLLCAGAAGARGVSGALGAFGSSLPSATDAGHIVLSSCSTRRRRGEGRETWALRGGCGGEGTDAPTSDATATLTSRTESAEAMLAVPAESVPAGIGA